MTETATASLPAVAGENLSLSKDEHSLVLLLNLSFLDSFVLSLAFRPIILGGKR